MIKQRKILAIMMLAIFTILLIQPTVILAASIATDYNFTDELEEDRIGIGFTWTANTRTLTITGIKNSEAEVILPAGSTISIQGKIENKVKYILCEKGDLTIEGNEEASLKVVGFYQNNNAAGIKEYKAIACKNLTIISGNIKIENTENGYSYTQGIKVQNIFTMKDGNLIINIRDSGSVYDAINAGKIVIDGGKIEITVYGTALFGDTIINGGELTIRAGGKSGQAFYEVPSIDPTVEWKILYDKSNIEIAEEDAIEADITDIYTIYKYKFLKISENNPEKEIKMLGDMNKDGKITPYDAFLINLIYEEDREPTEEELLIGDIDGNGKLTPNDAFLINVAYENGTELE